MEYNKYICLLQQLLVYRHPQRRVNDSMRVLSLVVIAISAAARGCDTVQLATLLSHAEADPSLCASLVSPDGCARLMKQAMYRICNDRRVVRDATLDGLASLLNMVPFNKSVDIEDLIPYITSWIAGEPEHPLRVSQRPDSLQLDCSQSKYASALTGTLDSKPALIVDLIPVGYDIDLLEIHLLELYEVVDVFVLFESPYTQQGVAKPCYFNKSLHATPARWARFLDKIVYMRPQRLPTAAQVAAARQATGRSWYLENQMRTDPMQQMQTSTHPLLVKAREHLHSALFLQHDADEIPSARAVLHLKHCSRRSAKTYYFPCTSYKLNTQWLQRTYDLVGLGRAWVKHASLDHYLWRPGPTARYLSAVLAEGTSGRYDSDSNTPHLGPGAAVHFSSTAEPAGGWLKRIGVVEAYGATQLPPALAADIVAGTVRGINLGMLTEPHCGREYYAVHVSKTDLADFLYVSLPWALRHNPLRYPFIHPLKTAAHCSYHNGNGDTCAWSSAGPTRAHLSQCETLYPTAP